MQALAIAEKKRLERARQRDALLDAPPEVVIAALVSPTEELASYRLSVLIANHGHGAIPLIGPAKLNAAFREVVRLYPVGRQVWHPALRLRDLSEAERSRLVAALVRRSAPAWRELAHAERTAAA